VYVSEEIFLCGSGWEITPILSLDRMPIGNGKEPRPITRAMQACYFAVVRGKKSAYRQWLTPVHPVHPR
jgi:branched-chain amino acid aminotransferase